MDDEYASVLDFVEYLLDDDRTVFTHADLTALSERLHQPVRAIRAELEGWGLTLAYRAPERVVRGYTAWDENRYQGNPGAGGTGYEQITGFAGRKG
jgi:hypothetical protein